MDKETVLQKVLHFFLSKIIIGLAIIGGSVVLIEWAGRFLLARTTLTDESINIIIGLSDAAIALTSYIFLFKFYERRKIKELSFSTFGRNALVGFATGLILQSLFILIIYIAGDYSVTRINPFSFLIPGFIQALTAGFVAEIIFCGLVFRLTEEKLGTIIAFFISAIIFVVAHASVKDATLISICATTLQAGIMLNAAYVYSRSLWLPIFLHFSWDFAEPAIYSGVNPGMTIEKTLFVSKITGNTFFTGGLFGPQNSIQALLLCSVTAVAFLWLANKKKNFIKPYWKKLSKE